MLFTDILTADRICIDTNSLSKTAVLLHASQLLAQSQAGLSSEKLFDAFWKRETLGSTAIGHGITIPHIRIAGIDKTQACFLKLQNPVDFGAEDKQPVDLVMAFIVPDTHADQHLTMLAATMHKFDDSAFRISCRQARNNEELYQALNQLRK